MLIKALCDYAEKQADTGIPEGWQEQGIHFRIHRRAMCRI